MKIEVYDPAMCCSTGVCGPGAEAAAYREVLRNTADLPVRCVNYFRD